MDGNKKVTFLLWIMIPSIIATLALTPLPKEPVGPVYWDDFEKYTGDHDLQKAYMVWEEGANIKVNLQKNLAHSGKQAMAVELISPNPSNQATNGSIYHILPLLLRKWSGGSGIRFWVDNSFQAPLLLSFNFKEEYNEYWSIASKGEFYLQSEDGTLHQQPIEFGNLPIPANYQGFVMVPFTNFSVPDWNTARGNKVMELARIESFAFAVNIGTDYPRKFWIDDFEVLGPTDYKALTIQGVSSIQVPVSGEHREQYAAYLHSLSNTTSSEVNALWQVVEPTNSSIKIDDHGWLTIPSGVKNNRVTISATYTSSETKITSEFIVNLIGSQVPLPPSQATHKIPATATPSAYEKFSTAFESWAVVNRPLFVAIIIGVLLIILALLSLFQRRVK